MATRRPVVLNEDDNRLETPQSGDEVRVDEFARLDAGLYLDYDFNDTWGAAIPSSPIFKQKLYIDQNGGDFPSYADQAAIRIDGTTDVSQYNGGYVTGVAATSRYSSNIADPGYTTIRGASFSSVRGSKDDVANNGGLWMFGIQAGVFVDANNTSRAGQGKTELFSGTIKLENGVFGNVYAISVQNLLATSNAWFQGGTSRDVDADNVVLGLRTENIFGNTIPTNNYVSVGNLYHIKLGAINGVSSNVTITNHYGIFQEQANCENVFEGTMTCNNAVVNMPNLPTSDPNVAGQLWNDSGTLKVSAG